MSHHVCVLGQLMRRAEEKQRGEGGEREEQEAGCGQHEERLQDGDPDPNLCSDTPTSCIVALETKYYAFNYE